MSHLIVVFATVYVLNVIPAFAPPTWMVLSFIGFNEPQLNPFSIAVVGAFAATFGRMTLALFSLRIIRNKLLNERSKENIDAVKNALEKHKSQTAWALLAYSFTPLPSGHLFIAYGLTTLPIRLFAIPFFIGRLASYAFWVSLVHETYEVLDMDYLGEYLSTFFIVTQAALLLLIYAFTKVDWRAALTEKKFRWLKKNSAS